MRNYLLPMFEKDIRKSRSFKKDQGSPRGLEGGFDSTVYGELKLSERLSMEMVQLRQEKATMLERIECLEVQSATFQKQMLSD